MEIYYKTRINNETRKVAYNHGKPWSTEDLAYLRDWQDKISREELAYSLGRSYHTVTVKIAELKEDSKIKACTNCKRELPDSYEFFYKDNNKTGTQCKECLAAKRKSRNNRENAKNHRKPWTTKEKEYLRENKDKLTVIEIAKKLDRTYNSVLAARTRMNKKEDR